MATGVAGGTGGTFPATVAHGAVQLDQRFADYNVTLNSLWGLELTTSRYLILTHRTGLAVSGWGTLNEDYRAAGGAAEAFYQDIPLYGTSGTVFQKVTAVQFYVNASSAMNVMTTNLKQAVTYQTDPTAGSSNLTSVNSAGTGYQLLTTTGLTNGNTHLAPIYTKVASGAATDRYHGCRILFNNSLYAV